MSPSPQHASLPRPRRIPWLNVGLFLATVATTLWAGAFMAGEQSWNVWSIVKSGWTFSLPLILALGTHEMGHFLVARRHGLYPSWPFFIPAPTFFGTFGAVIRMRFVVPPTRAQLFDVGIAGPLAGFVVSVACLFLGARWSTVELELTSLETYSLAQATGYWLSTGSAEWFGRVLGGHYLVLGDSLLVQFLIWAATGDAAANTVLHPVAFAGWVGLFVTMLNLMPVGQLDGGHVAYALLGRHFRWMPRVVIPLLLVLGFVGWPGWFVWAGLVAFIGAGHPPASGEALGRGRLLLAWVCLIIFVLIFTPVPFATAW